MSVNALSFVLTVIAPGAVLLRVCLLPYARQETRRVLYVLQNQFSAYVKKAVHNRRIQFLTEKSRKFRFETPLFDLDYLLFDTTDIIQEITDHETVRQALRSIKENERRIVLERIIEEKSFGQLSDELGMSYKTVASLYYRAIKKLRRFMEEGESK